MAATPIVATTCRSGETRRERTNVLRQTAVMTHPIWPFFDLRVVTPMLELLPIDDETGTELALLAAKGVHDPGYMPFGVPWTDAPSPELERNALQFYWRTRAEFSPTNWMLNFAVAWGGQLVGSTGFFSRDYPTVRTFETGSWLGREFQGQGIGKEMRVANLQLGFLGFDARIATTAAWEDNGPSLGVTRRLGYADNGQQHLSRRGVATRQLRFHMTREYFEQHLQRDDIVLRGVEPCLPLLGL
jgi:RimJ/RimL family protein N-acetyltransferase